MNVSERVTCQIDVPDHNAESFISAIESHQLESLILKITGDRRVDIGALCYTKRNFKPGIPASVNLSTLSHQRCTAIKSWCIEVISGVFTGESPYSVHAKALGLRAYLNWCDGNGHTACLESDELYKKSLSAYTEHLLLLIHDKQIEGSTARLRQHMALQSGNFLFPNSQIDFSSDIPLLYTSKRFRTSQKEATETPEENEIGEYLAACQYIFDGLTDFVIKGTPYPHRIPFFNTEVTIAPPHDQLFTHYTIANNKLLQKVTSWNLGDAHHLTPQELMAQRSLSRVQAINLHRRSKETLDSLNSDKYHDRRIALARYAQDAFHCLFIANTAMNESAARQIPWNPEYEVTNSSNAGFLVIKYRANNLEQYFEIKKSFLKHFQKYIKLRLYLNEIKPVNYLFPSYNYSQINNAPARFGAVYFFGKSILSRLDPSIKFFAPRQLRKYKAIYLLSRKHSISTVSAVIQNSPASTIKNYTEAAEKTAIDEISTTIKFITELLDQRSKIDTPTGKCSGSPPAEAIKAPENYEPNCKNFAGCTFCENFTVHADEESIRKILSMRYVTAEKIDSCTDIDQFDRLHGATLKRIDDIISELLVSRPELNIVVDKIRRDIEDECELSSYWLLMYERLIKLKIIK